MSLLLWPSEPLDQGKNTHIVLVKIPWASPIQVETTLRWVHMHAWWPNQHNPLCDYFWKKLYIADSKGFLTWNKLAQCTENISYGYMLSTVKLLTLSLWEWQTCLAAEAYAVSFHAQQATRRFGSWRWAHWMFLGCWSAGRLLFSKLFPRNVSIALASSLFHHSRDIHLMWVKLSLRHWEKCSRVLSSKSEEDLESFWW